MNQIRTHNITTTKQSTMRIFYGIYCVYFMEYTVYILWNILCIFYGILCAYFMEYTVYILWNILCIFMEYTVHILWNILCIFYGIYCVYFMEYTVYILWNILCVFYGIYMYCVYFMEYTVYILWNILYKAVDLAVVIKFSVSYLNLSQSCSHLGCYWMLLILDFKGLINTLRPGEGWMYQWHESSFYFRLP